MSSTSLLTKIGAGQLVVGGVAANLPTGDALVNCGTLTYIYAISKPSREDAMLSSRSMDRVRCLPTIRNDLFERHPSGHEYTADRPARS